MTKTILLATAAILLTAGTAAAQTPPSAHAAPAADAAQQGILVFTPDFFADQRPNTALDMVGRVPGFSVQDGDGSRGFEGAVGNILINGSRPASKNDTGSSVLSRTLVANLITGVTEGYTTKMEIFGVGYRVQQKGSNLEFALGYSHPVLIEAPEGITFAVESPTKFSVSGIDKQKVGQISSNIRRLRRPDPYKGKGVRYEGEQIRRKVGKTGK